MSQKHLDLLLNQNSAFWLTAPMYDEIAAQVNRWTLSETKISDDISNPDILMQRYRNWVQYYNSIQNYVSNFDNLKRLNQLYIEILIKNGGDQNGKRIPFGTDLNLLRQPDMAAIFGFPTSPQLFQWAILKASYDYSYEIDKKIIREELLARPEASSGAILDFGITVPDWLRAVAGPLGYVRDAAYRDATGATDTELYAAYAVAAGVGAAVGLGTASSAAAAASSGSAGATGVGTTLSEVSVTMGAESAAAVAAPGVAAAPGAGIGSTLSGLVSGQGAAAAAAATALVESEGKKFFENAINDLTGQGEISPENLAGETPISGPATVKEVSQNLGIGALALAALLLFL